MKTKRNSTIEALRILSMMMIVALHYMNKSIGGGLNTELPINVITSHIIESICITSVNVFVLISGYYMQGVRTTGLGKAIDLYLVMLFYHVPSFIIAVLTGQSEFTLKNLVYAVAPFLLGIRWFLETYIILLLIAPFLNVLLNNINKKKHLLLIGIQVLLFSIWPSINPSATMNLRGYGITNFITLYFIAGFIRRYVSFSDAIKTRRLMWILFVASCTAITLSSFLPYFGARAWDYCYIFNIVASVSLFTAFLNLPRTDSGFVNTVASTTFGVYISHTVLYFQPLVYKTLLQTDRFLNSPFQPLHCIVSVLILFTACSALDMLRQKLWRVTVDKWLRNLKILKAVERWEASIICPNGE